MDDDRLNEVESQIESRTSRLLRRIADLERRLEDAISDVERAISRANDKIADLERKANYR
ncbi:MAG: hypothetical protein DMG78_14915 [Acidobacteria bacterium]|nr:MAG: hypothetical protein DMG78_14915 [Acidobacteriota bacterium]